MDRNSIIGIFLIVGILIVYGITTSPSKEELQAKRRQQDSIALIEQANEELLLAEKMKADSINTIAAGKNLVVPDSLANDSAVVDSLQKSALVTSLGVFANCANGEAKTFTIESDLLKLKLSTQGGKINYAELKKYKTWLGEPLVLFDNDTSQFALSFYHDDDTISTQELFFEAIPPAPGDSFTVSGTDSLQFAMRLYPVFSNREMYIEYLYTIHGNDYMSGLAISMKNMNDLVVEVGDRYINFNWTTTPIRQEKSYKNEQIATSVYYKHFEEGVDYLSETSDDRESIPTRIKWVSFKQQFFSHVLISETGFENADLSTNKVNSETYLKNLSAQIGIPYSGNVSESHPMRFYMGPNHYKTLRKYGLSLERQIPLGWSFFIMGWVNRFIVIPVFHFLEGFNISYGIIILLLTIFIKLLLFPIAYKTYLSSAKMKLLKPEIEVIAAKFPKKEDSVKKQQATMGLYKKAGVNPMSGCIPMLLQFPILIALFRFFPASIELRQQSFLWADDLSSYDSIVNLGVNIPFYGDHVSLFTLLMTISTVIYTRVNMGMMGQTNTMPGMKIMMYAMPVLFLGIFNNYASGLSYYYFLANMITFGQQFIIKKYIVNEAKLRKQIELNQKKPAKKSRWAARLEDMAKQRGYQPKKK
ncbi:MAG: membrane protein insertase YidC [Bacteroidetes bacterium]|nr:membrane protein insertase YidC [Bacteroidota bacterium]MBU1719041.1 membrane protein insertase YidC [Bacteroidota bacterium]